MDHPTWKDLDKLKRERDAYRKLAAKWAQQAQIECGEGIDPGFSHCLEVIDDQVKKLFEEKGDGK